MTWFFLSLLTALSDAAVSLADKFLLLRYVKTSTLAVKLLGLFSLIAVGIVFTFWDHPELSLGAIWPFLAGFFEISYIFFYLRAIEKNLVAYVIPMFAFSPLFLLAISVVFFHEKIHLVPLLAVFLILFGLILLVLAKEGSLKIQKDRFFIFILLSTFFYTLYSLFLDRGLMALSLLEIFFYSRAGVVVGAVLISLLTKSFHLAELKNRQSYFFGISEVLYLGSIYLFLESLEKGPAAYVVTVVNIQPLFVFALSYLLWRLSPKILQEDFAFVHTRLAIVSIGLIIAGSSLLSF